MTGLAAYAGGAQQRRLAHPTSGRIARANKTVHLNRLRNMITPQVRRERRGSIRPIRDVRRSRPGRHDPIIGAIPSERRTLFFKVFASPS